MKLTKDQIQQVEKFIAYKEVDYIDLKLEILDHMVSEIEEKMQKNTSFIDAFEFVAKKWNKHFAIRTSLYFGSIYPAPKIVLESAKKVYKPYYFTMFALYFIPMILLNKFAVSIENNTQYYLNVFLKISGGFSLFLLMYSYYKSKKLRHKTIYSFILKTPYPSIFIGLIVLFTSYFSKDNTLRPISIGMWFIFMFVSWVSWIFYKKHKSIIKKQEL